MMEGCDWLDQGSVTNVVITNGAGLAVCVVE